MERGGTQRLHEVREMTFFTRCPSISDSTVAACLFTILISLFLAPNGSYSIQSTIDLSCSSNRSHSTVVLDLKFPNMSSTYNVLEKERSEPSKIIVVSSAYWDSLQSELPNLIPRISVSLLTALPKISAPKINK